MSSGFICGFFRKRRRRNGKDGLGAGLLEDWENRRYEPWGKAASAACRLAKEAENICRGRSERMIVGHINATRPLSPETE